jgi:hypothetical protein
MVHLYILRSKNSITGERLASKDKNEINNQGALQVSYKESPTRAGAQLAPTEKEEPSYISINLLSLSHDTLVVPRPDVLQGTLEVALRAVETGVRFVLAGLQIGVDELDETVEILRGDCLVLLVEVVDVAVEDFDKEFDGHGGIHAGICDTQGTL